MGRSEDNQALKDLDRLVTTIAEFEGAARRVLVRNRFSTGQKFHYKGELGEMEGTPGPFYGDPTGEDAVWDEVTDSLGKTISAMASAISKWLIVAKWILELSSTDVKKRAQRTIPDCLACGDPCYDKVRSGFDAKCYQRWKRAGRPDRVKFIREQQAERAAKAEETPPP